MAKKKTNLQSDLNNVYKAGKRNVKKMGKSLSKSIPGRSDPLKGVYKSAFRLAKSGARLAVMNPYVSTTLGIASYLTGSTSRRYAKAPKVGTGRNLANKKITDDGFDF
jgi:hypothetical protein